MKSRYPDLETREKVCGSLKAKHERKDLQSPEELVFNIKKIQKKNPNLSLREILEKAFHSKDFIEDSINELIEWVSNNIETDEPESVAFAIINSRKKKKQTKKEQTKEEKEKGWQETWKEIGGEFERRRKERNEPLPKKKILQKIKQITLKEETPKESLVKKAKELIEKGRYILPKSSISILQGEINAYNQGKEDELEEFVPMIEKRYHRMKKEYIKETQEQEKKRTQQLKLYIRNETRESLKKQLNKLEKESDQLRLKTKALRPDERTQRKATIVNRTVAVAQEKELIKEALKRFDELKKGDFEEDVARRPGRPRTRGLKAGTPSALAGGARTTKVAQGLKKSGIPLSVGPSGVQPIGEITKITKPLTKTQQPQFIIPFDIYNQETGEIVFGETIENLLGREKQMRPVSSSNVKAVGQFNNELLVQFLTSPGTYRYQFTNPEMAEEAYTALTETGSPGRWIWQNIRGHKAGEKVTASKIGPSIINKTPTIGGTSASLVEYELGSRTPVTRVPNFDELSKKVMRTTPNPTQDPSTGARIEGELAGRLVSRNLGKNVGRISQLRAGLPKIDFKEIVRVNPTRIYIGNIYELTRDQIDFSEFKIQKNDFKESDFTVFNGPITRSGAFDYVKNGKKTTYYKDWDNIKEKFSEINYLPYRLAQTGSHRAEEYGFAYNFTPNEETEQMFADIVVLEDIEDLESIIENKSDYHVSIGFEDHIIKGDVQIIDKLDHLAGSGTETGRCSTGGEEGKRDCIIKKLHDQNQTEVVS